jgi:divalent metal cation (Fe/Co/Zn/Cd) transporter
VGEGATDADHEKIEQAILAGTEVERIIHMKTLYLGPDELLVAAKVGFHADQRLLEVSAAVNVIEERVRHAVPAARVIYLEPDIWVDPNLTAPPTDAIVIKGLE